MLLRILPRKAEEDGKDGTDSHHERIVEVAGDGER